MVKINEHKISIGSKYTYKKQLYSCCVNFQSLNPNQQSLNLQVCPTNIDHVAIIHVKLT